MSDLEAPSPFWDHISDLQRTFIRCLLTVGVAFAVSLYFYQSIFGFLTVPLSNGEVLEHQLIQHERISNHGNESVVYTLPDNSSIVTMHDAKQVGETSFAIEPYGYVDLEVSKPLSRLMVFSPSEGLMTVLKTCFWVATVGSSPIWLLMIMSFVSPALRLRERMLVFPFLLFSLLFLTMGMLFAYWVTIPIANNYLQAFNSGIGENLWSVRHYLDYTVMLILANGLSFECWVILGFLVHFDMVTPKMMTSCRRYVYVGIFILSAIATPPDVVTQILLASPLIALYELTILYSRCKGFLAHFCKTEQLEI